MTLNKTESFFPSARKELFLTSITALANRAGEKRLKLSFTMPLMDGKLIGMPEWLSEPFVRVQKAELGVASVRSLVELDSMTVRLYSNDQVEEPALELPGVLLKSFIVRRVSEDKTSAEVCDAEMAFQLYTGWNQKLWKWGWTYFHGTSYAVFVSTQATLSFGPSKKEAEEEAETEDAGALEFGADESDNADSPAARSRRAAKRPVN